MDQCCFCYNKENLTNILPCVHPLCRDCVTSATGDLKCPSCVDTQINQTAPPVTGQVTPPSAGRTISVDDELSSLLQEIPLLQQQVHNQIAAIRKGQRMIEQEVNEVKKNITESSEMAVKNINHRTKKLLEQVEETEQKRKHGILSLMGDTTDNKGALQVICLLAMALADSDSDDFATVALGDELVGALQAVQAQCLQLDFDEDFRGLGMEFAERPQDASIGTLVRKQNCIGISTLDNGEYLLAVDQRNNGGVCLGRARKDKTDDVRWILAFQPLDVVAPVILGCFSATKTDKEQNIFLAVGREVFTVNMDRLFSTSTVASSTSVRNYRLNFLHQDARITAIDWYPTNPNHVIIANDKTEVLHIVNVVSSTVLKEIHPQVNFTAANSLMTLNANGKVVIAIASEISRKAAMLTEDGKLAFYFKKPSEFDKTQSPAASLPRTLFLSTVTQLLIIRQSKIGVMWVDERKGKPPIYVLYDTDDGTWRRLFTIDEKTPVGVTFMPPKQLAFCYSSARVKVAGFSE